MSPRRTLSAVIFVMFLAASLASPATANHGRGALPESKNRVVNVVNVNIREGFTEKPDEMGLCKGQENGKTVTYDAAYSDHRREDFFSDPDTPNWGQNTETQYPAKTNCSVELNRFVERLRKILHVQPDLIVLQEINGVASDRLAYQLTERMAGTYKVGSRAWNIPKSNIRPADCPRHPDKKRAADQRDVSVLYNSATMTYQHSGWATTSYSCGESALTKIAHRQAGFGVATEKSSGLKTTIMSVHLATRKHVDEDAQGRVWKRWSGVLAGAAAEENVATDIIAGDFNNLPCASNPESYRCDHRAWWEEFRSRGYVDTVRKTASRASNPTNYLRAQQRGYRIDFIFAKGSTVCKAFHDNPAINKYYGQKDFVRKNLRTYITDHLPVIANVALNNNSCPN